VHVISLEKCGFATDYDKKISMHVKDMVEGKWSQYAVGFFVKKRYTGQ